MKVFLNELVRVSILTLPLFIDSFLISLIVVEVFYSLIAFIFKFEKCSRVKKLLVLICGLVLIVGYSHAHYINDLLYIYILITLLLLCILLLLLFNLAMDYRSDYKNKYYYDCSRNLPPVGSYNKTGWSQKNISKDLDHSILRKPKSKLENSYNSMCMSNVNNLNVENSKYLHFYDQSGYVTLPFDLKPIVYSRDGKALYSTKKGDFVRSHNEQLIADRLYDSSIAYQYEKAIILENILCHPDFTIIHPRDGKVIYWEHCGMMDIPDYRLKWERKKKLYNRNNIVEGNNLIVTYNQITDYEINMIIHSLYSVGFYS